MTGVFEPRLVVPKGRNDPSSPGAYLCVTYTMCGHGGRRIKWLIPFKISVERVRVWGDRTTYRIISLLLTVWQEVKSNQVEMVPLNVFNSRMGFGGL